MTSKWFLNGNAFSSVALHLFLQPCERERHKTNSLKSATKTAHGYSITIHQTLYVTFTS